MRVFVISMNNFFWYILYGIERKVRFDYLFNDLEVLYERISEK